ncbi:MAG: beta-ribofuranosylaminobenzene 5'-phosphate synthase [Candidatus Methanogaster sp.]|uniref:Beta-ribofuranosylaminobenzene 5'-phosphate synthase n=1 Tax=Candidatus Methanogaster sp. TaxID=3386292 RepID=A0AC61L7Q0_9EURY|nr:MAG: beta-ribofuranosylaminobenzene 5'-phosphate synthase [ANME-2 cluster archaeon]
MTIEITTPSRLHITLIDLNASIGRVDGGIGLTIGEPGIRIKAEVVEAAEGVDGITVAGDSELTGRMRESARAILPEGCGVRIHIEQDSPSHVGLGTGTQAALAAGMAVNRLYNLSMSVRDIAIAVGRGGTSGIGVASFESGGFILDSGHKFSEKGVFKPSAASQSPPASILFQQPFPDWEIVLAIPGVVGAHDAREVDIFGKECPIPLSEVRKLSHIILMETLPSVVEGDIEAFGDSINRIQDVGFKRREIALQEPEIVQIIKRMQESTCGAGMSSFGPAVYGITDSRRAAADTMHRVQEFLDATLGGRCMVVHARNSGADVCVSP